MLRMPLVLSYHGTWRPTLCKISYFHSRRLPKTVKHLVANVNAHCHGAAPRRHTQLAKSNSNGVQRSRRHTSIETTSCNKKDLAMVAVITGTIVAHLQHWHMALRGSPVQGSTSVVVAGAHFASEMRKQLHHPQVASIGGAVQRSAPVHI